jgi:CRISPR/Cas system Type II protein with McrA/HNH and RuvC-like nuclease domain
MTENLQDPVLDEEELTPAQIARNEEIAVGNELTEAAKKFHLMTAAYVMSLEHYKRIRRALCHEEEDPANPWQPVQGDMFQGYPVMVCEGENIQPHIEMVDRDLRPSYYAGVTSLGIERNDMKEPPFPGANDEATAAASLSEGHEEEAEGDDAAPAQPGS